MSDYIPRIVVITIPGNSKRAFTNALHKNTDGAVSLVIIQKQSQKTLVQRFRALIRENSWRNVPKQLWYAFLLRVSSSKRKVLELFRRSSMDNYRDPYIPPAIEVDSVNSDSVYKKLLEISPDLIVVWGSGILKPHIIATAKKVINLHLGLCPYYRGAIANQYAVFQGDISKVGVTIHYVNNHVDAGDIIKTIALPTLDSFEKSFLALNDEAFSSYVEIAKDMFYGKEISSYPQNASLGKNIILKQWTPEMRYKTAQKMLS